MSNIIYRTQGFKTIEEARKFSKEHGGVITTQIKPYSNQYGGIRKHKEECWCTGVDPDKYPAAVHWNELIKEKE